MSFLPRPPAGASLVVDLARIVGASAVSTAEADRFAYSRDLWPRDLIRLRSGEVPAAPSCVVWPETPEEVARVLRLAAEPQLPVVPWGAGSGVAGGARPSLGGIVLDLKRMRAIRQLDDKNLRVEVESGIIGERLERSLNRRGYTLGHFPSSIICSTLGGWLAARSAGQTSTLYGKIEDMTLGLELVSPGRVRRSMWGPRPGPGPDYNALVIGSEGTFGVITAAELRMRPLPERRQMRGLRFPNIEAGAEAIRLMLREGLRPAVVRLYDALDTFIGRGHGEEDEAADQVGSFDALGARAKAFYEDLQNRLPSRELATKLGRSLLRSTVRAVLGAPLVLNRAAGFLPEECLLILGFEGQPAIVGAEFSRAMEICAAGGAEDLGPGPGDHWLANRYNVSFKLSKAYASGAFADTMEVASTWDRLMPMYEAVRKALSKDAFVMAHFSHAYPEGCSIYFTFAGVDHPDDPSGTLGRYDRIWRNAMSAVHESGGTLSHHHGVGELKADAMAREHGPGGMRLLSALKQGFDPRGISNPGKLGIEYRAVAPANRRLRVRARELPKEIAAAVGEKNLFHAGGRTTVRPPDENTLAAVLRVAHNHAIPVATDQAGRRASRGATHVDLARFEGVSRLSSNSLFVEAEAGVVVERLEALLHRSGLSLGLVHPRSLQRSVGASLALNLLVRRGTAHGDLRGLCFAVRGLLPNGEPIETRPVPRSATGPELDRALIGAQERWGIITKATLRVVVAPTVRESVAFAFDELSSAIECARRALRRGVRPAAGRVLSDGRIALLLHGQSKDLVAPQTTLLVSVAEELGGRRLEDGPDPVGGKFDAVVESAALWTQAGPMLEAMKRASSGEAWLDFLAPEGVTVVARVVDRETRAAAIEAGLAAGGRILGGSRQSDLDDSSRTSLSEEAGPVVDRGPFEDIADKVGSAIDPSDVFRGREETP